MGTSAKCSTTWNDYWVQVYRDRAAQLMSMTFPTEERAIDYMLCELDSLEHQANKPDTPQEVRQAIEAMLAHHAEARTAAKAASELMPVKE